MFMLGMLVLRRNIMEDYSCADFSPAPVTLAGGGGGPARRGPDLGTAGLASRRPGIRWQRNRKCTVPTGSIANPIFGKMELAFTQRFQYRARAEELSNA